MIVAIMSEVLDSSPISKKTFTLSPSSNYTKYTEHVKGSCGDKKHQNN